MSTLNEVDVNPNDYLSHRIDTVKILDQWAKDQRIKKKSFGSLEPHELIDLYSLVSSNNLALISGFTPGAARQACTVRLLPSGKNHVITISVFGFPLVDDESEGETCETTTLYRMYLQLRVDPSLVKQVICDSACLVKGKTSGLVNLSNQAGLDYPFTLCYGSLADGALVYLFSHTAMIPCVVSGGALIPAGAVEGKEEQEEQNGREEEINEDAGED